MKLIYCRGFSKSERLWWKPVIFRNIIEALRAIYGAMTEINYQCEIPENNVGFFLLIKFWEKQNSGYHYSGLFIGLL